MITYACNLQWCLSHASPSAASNAFAAPADWKTSRWKFPRLITWYSAPSNSIRSRRAMPQINLRLIPTLGFRLPRKQYVATAGVFTQASNVLRPDPVEPSIFGLIVCRALSQTVQQVAG